jgi:hypothetical protein
LEFGRSAVAHSDGAEGAEWCGRGAVSAFVPETFFADCRLVDCGRRQLVDRKSRWVSFIRDRGGYSRFLENPPRISRLQLLCLVCAVSAVQAPWITLLHLKTFLSRMSGPHMATGVALLIPVSERGLGVFCRQAPRYWVLSIRRNESPFLGIG